MPKKITILIICVIGVLVAGNLIGMLNDRYGRVGLASWYGEECRGKKTASGEIYDPDKLTVAHRRLPFGTVVKVTNLANKRQVTVTINDRGPSKRGRIIDVSLAAARQLGIVKKGLSLVKIEILRP